MKIVIIGGVAAGPKTAARLNRLMPEAEITLIEKERILSYAGCGLPYYVSGEVKSQEELLSTPIGVVRDPIFFQKVKNVKVLNRTLATEIDRKNKRVHIRSRDTDQERWLEYDQLVLATGARPVTPPISGVDMGNIFSLQSVEDAESIRAALAEDKARDVVILGGGLIGVESTEALVSRGCRVTIVEMLPHVMSMLDSDMAGLLERHMESHGVKIMTNTKALSFKGDAGVVQKVVTDRGELNADMVIMAVGVRPNSDLAAAAGLELGPRGGIRIDKTMRASDPDVFAVGDCVENTHLITGESCFVPLGSTANKHGRVAAGQIAGRKDDEFPGVLGSTVCKVFDFCVGRTGLSEAEAREKGYDVDAAVCPGPDKAHYMPQAKVVFLKLIFDKATRRILGLQAVGPGEGDKRVDVAAMAITAGMTVDQLANADLCYAPPYSPAVDGILTAANIARNKLDGLMEGIRPERVHEKIEAGEDIFMLDVRSPGEYKEVRIPNSTLIPLGKLRESLDQIPRDKEIVTYCKVSLRGYEAYRTLKGVGFDQVRVMDGGIVMWPYEKEAG